VALSPERLSVVEKLRLGGEIVASYGRVRLSLRRDDLPTLLARLREGTSPDASWPNGRAYAEARRLGAVVERTLGATPQRSRCLVSSLVLTQLLARRGVSSTLVIGVSPGEDFGAHAWVELGGKPLLPAGGAVYQRLAEL
jgi:hypothetical protein